MKGLLFLLCCIEILGTLLCGAEPNTASPAPGLSIDIPETTNPITTSISVLSTTSVSTTQATKLTSTQSAKTVSDPFKSYCPPSTAQESTTFVDMIFKEESLPLLMVTGGLMIVCTILLLSTLLLSCKVCRLSRRIKVLSSNADMISNSEYWMGTAKGDKGKSEEEPKETTVLMADVNQTQEEVGSGATKEEGKKVNVDEQMEEEKKREEGDTAKTEEASTAPVAAAENSSPSELQEEATDSQPDKAAAASTSEGTEEAKDVV
ncbi:uncharacterized protein [Pagrus major]|uniref:uncharacterized protein n=1 Tax=Pagrus major TaxID=143350 RepID=UPI003CC8B564